ncbi:MAG: extracellular solute-binding protein, partial [Ruthenibacterium sp.]
MKKVLSIVLALALTLSLAACGGAASSAPASTAASAPASAAASAPATGAIEEGAKLVYWPMWSETEPQGQVISAAIDAFTAETGVDVEVNWGKYILDIQSMYDASPLSGKQNATLINLAKELGGGSLKSVPYQPSTFQVMYNKAAFEKAGIKETPKTWDELMAACESL